MTGQKIQNIHHCDTLIKSFYDLTPHYHIESNTAKFFYIAITFVPISYPSTKNYNLCYIWKIAILTLIPLLVESN